MKHSSLFRMPLLLIVAGAALFFAPACKAQSEVSPDHFDGTDSWATAAQTPRQVKHKQTVAKSGLTAQTQKNAQASKFHLASSREVSKPAPKQTAAVDRKRKPATSDPEKK